jgi:hypothetical protein
VPIAQVTPIPPAELYAIVLKFGYRLLGQTQYNWIVSRDGEDEPLVLPKLGHLVSLTIMNKFFEHSGMDLGTYFALKAMISGGTDTVH